MGFLSFRYFLTTIEEMHISRAAQRLCITQQTLSVHIKKLEEQYDVRLFERKPTLKLTLAGERMAVYARRILQIEKQMDAELTDITDNKIGKLTVGITRTAASSFMPALWDRYHELFPNISITLIDALSDSLAELLQEDKIDLYIGGYTSKYSNTCCVQLVKHEFCCLFSQKFLQRELPDEWEKFLTTYKSGVGLLKIAQFPLIMLPRNDRLRTTVEQFYTNHQINPRVLFETSMLELVYHLCLNGNGVGLLSKMYLEKYMRNNNRENTDTDLYILPITDNIFSNTMNLVYKANTPQARYMRSFIKTVKDVFHID
ncbi:LysR family transcriptional regulator [Synergistales bacterium]|nr:LysR family transcriptional regulator [Synergistales bacterium]